MSKYHSICSAGQTLRAVFGLAWKQLAHDRLRTLIAICGVAIAVLSITLLAGTGLGVIAVGEQQFEAADRDLWMTGGSFELSAAGGGGFANSIHDSHEVAADISDRDGVRTAVPMAFQTVYVGTDEDQLEPMVGTGAPTESPLVSIADGEPFSNREPHYAGGSYDGPMSHEVIIDKQTADTYDVDIGDTLHIGGSLAAARNNEFEVVGISPTFARFLGAPTVTVPLSELQTITGTSGTDSATLITISLEDDATLEEVQADIEAAYPEYEVQTNREQLRSVAAQQATLIAGAVVLVALALLTGTALTSSLLALFVHQHRTEFATLSALGVSRQTISGIVVAQSLVITFSGWIFGIGATVPSIALLNKVGEVLVGFDSLVVIEMWVLLVSGGIAIGIGIFASVVALWRLPHGSQLS